MTTSSGTIAIGVSRGATSHVTDTRAMWSRSLLLLTESGWFRQAKAGRSDYGMQLPESNSAHLRGMKARVGSRSQSGWFPDCVGWELMRSVRLWDAKSGEIIRTISDRSCWPNQTGSHSVPPEIESRRHRMTKPSKFGTQYRARRCITVTGHTASVEGVAFSPDGKQLASTSSGEKTIRIWDSRTGNKSRSSTIPVRNYDAWLSVPMALG